jgi:hypothetical protein
MTGTRLGSTRAAAPMRALAVAPAALASEVRLRPVRRRLLFAAAEPVDPAVVPLVDRVLRRPFAALPLLPVPPALPLLPVPPAEALLPLLPWLFLVATVPTSCRSPALWRRRRPSALVYPQVGAW